MGRRDETSNLARPSGGYRSGISACAGAIRLAAVGVLLAAAAGGLPCGVWAAEPPAVLINEVLYDPPGKDAGLEFVELLNVSDLAVSLGGWQLETGNGSGEGKWTLEWSGAETDTLRPHSFFVIGEDLVSPSPDRTTDLDLQNGPDACRLVSPDGRSDVVGWGEHTYPEYYEGAPVECPASGLSIGRDPDGTDTDWNAADLRGLAQASPGSFNHPPCDLVPARAGLSRHTPGTGATIDLVCTVSNLGTGQCGEGGEVLAAVGTSHGIATLGGAISANASLKLVVSLANPGAGLHAVSVWVKCDSDGRDTNDTLATTLVLPPPPVVINEVMFKPTGKACEWIELRNRSAGPLDLMDWTLEDSGGRPRRIANGNLAIDPGGFVLLVEDPDLFAIACGDSCGVLYLEPPGGWPTLNDVDGPLGFADAVVIRDAFGTAVDSVAYGQGWSKPGVSIERISAEEPAADPANWSPHYGGPGGTPGRPNSVSFFLPQGGDMLKLSPSTFSPNGDGRDDLVGISVRLPGAGQLRLAVYDVNGRLVRRLVDGEPVESARLTFWDGADDHGVALPTGIYIVAAAARLNASDRALAAKGAVVLARR